MCVLVVCKPSLPFWRKETEFRKQIRTTSVIPEVHCVLCQRDEYVKGVCGMYAFENLKWLVYVYSVWVCLYVCVYMGVHIGIGGICSWNRSDEAM